MMTTKFPFQHSVHINLACWNVLADSYAYSHCLKSTPETAVPKYIEWDYRKNRIANSITSSGADILCLQEVDHYTDFFEPLLEKLGYKSLYLQRHKRKDGCLIAYNSEKFNVDGVDEVQFDDIANFMESESSKSNVKRSNVALIAILSSKQFPAKKFVSSTAHVYWNPRRPEVKSLQTQYLVSRISSFIAAEGLPVNIPVFIAGDFNSVPFSEPYQLLVNGFESSFSVKGAAELANIGRTLYGPTTKFLCDRNLSRLCRWMRVLGIDTALIPDASCDHSSAVIDVNPPPSKIYKKNKQSFEYIFGRAREEQRVILTTSKSMRERSSCPPSFLVSTRNLEAALIKVCKEYGLTLDQGKFLTVCGKCGGEIESCSHNDPRVSKNIAVPPPDREIFVCKECDQPYWWNDRENSSPAKAMKMADRLYTAVSKSILDDEKENAPSNGVDDLNEFGEEDFDSRDERDEPLSFELTERITIAMQSTEIKEENLDMFLSTTKHTRPPSTSTPDPVQTLSTSFSKRDQIVKRKTVNALQNIKSNGNIHGDAEPSSVLSTLLVEDANSSSVGLESEVVCEKEVDSTGMADIDASAEEEGQTKRDEHSPRKFRSAFAAIHDGKEARVTNWSSDFKDTLDYVFMSSEWHIEDARVVPRVLSPSQAKGTPLVGGEGSAAEKPKVFPDVDGPQPSETWPSDHFMIVVKASI